MSRLKQAFLYCFKKVERVRALVLAGSFLIGELILLIATLAAGNDEAIPIGTFCAAVICGIFSLFVTVVCFSDDFSELIRLGVTRKCALLAVTVETLVVPMLYVFAVVLLELIENFIFVKLLGLEGLGLVFTHVIPIALGVVVVMWIMGLLASWCIRRFGVNGMIAIYCIYLVLFFLLPRLLHNLIDSFPIVSAAVELIVSNSVAVISAAALLVIVCVVLLLRGIYKTSI